MAINLEERSAEDRWQSIRNIWSARENQWLYGLVGFLAGVLITPFFMTQKDVLGNLFPEAFGILFTVLVINSLSEQRAERLLKEQLIRQMTSRHNLTALLAVEELRQLKLGIGDDKALEGKDLSFAILHDADLRDVNLQRASLHGVNLKKADLFHANLQSDYRPELGWGQLIRFTDPDHADFKLFPTVWDRIM
jgi:hypothetical protein